MNISFHDTLWNMRNEDLLLRLKLLEVKPEIKHKGGLIDTLKRAYAGDGLRGMWDTLSELEQAAVSEAVYHSDHRFQGGKLAAKYGACPSFYDAPEKERSWYSSNPKYATRMHLFFFSTKETHSVYIPSDLAGTLRSFVSQPEEAKPVDMDSPPGEEGLVVRNTEAEALAEVMALLRLAEAGNLRVSDKTAMPSAAGVRKILDCLPMGDFYPPEVAFLPEKKSWEQEIGAIKPVAWSRLLVNAGYVDVSGTKSKLTRKGMKALSESPHNILKDLWVKWVENKRYDEFNRVEAIKGQNAKGRPMTEKTGRRAVIESSLCDCPVGKWVETDDFSTYMRAADRLFEVARLPSKLYFGDPHYGNLGYSGFGGWNVLQFRYILCLLFEYAATLGMVDVAYVHPGEALNDLGGIWGADNLWWLSRYDGLRAFRLTELGAYFIGMEADFVPSPSTSTLVLEVGGNLVIRHKSGTLEPTDRLLLEAWAEKIETDAWRLNRELALSAVERGQKAEDFAAFLRSRDPQPLPQTVEGFLIGAERDGQAVRFSCEALLFECRDEETAERICSHKTLATLCHRSGRKTITVPVAHAEKFRDGVRKLGMGVV